MAYRQVEIMPTVSWGATLRTSASIRWRWLAAGLGVIAVLASTSCSSGPAKAVTPPWKTIWADNFNGPADSSVDTKYWEFNTGNGIFGTGEVETMTSSPYNIQLNGKGDLNLIVLGHGAAGSKDAAWTSGRIRTKTQFTPPVGGEMMVTASIKQPDPANAVGYWPGFWMLGSKMWPASGEIDIMEDVNGLSQDSGALHCGNLTQKNPDGTFGPCHETSGLGSGLLPCTSCQTAFHTYSVIIDRRNASNQQIRWYLDGKEFFSINESRVGAAAWTAAVDHGWSILFDLAVGGAYPNIQCKCTAPNDQTSSQGAMEIQYVKVLTN
jgi:beta-glucanase (GH16 family)